MQNRELDIICLGRAGIDLNPTEFNMPMENVTGFIKSVGGSPANIAVGTARQGLKVGFIGRVSDNALGRYIKAYLKDCKIDTTGLLYDSNHSNCLALTQVKGPDDCGVILYREQMADLYLECKDIDEAYIKSAKMLMISGTALAKSPSREATLLAIEYARRNHTKVVIDIDYRPYSWETKEETSIYYSLACEKSDIIIGTREEFDAVEYLWNKENKDDNKTAKYFLDLNTEIVVIKKSEKGATSYLKNGDSIKVGIVPTKVRKTFGAGDGYASGYLTGLVNKKTIKECMICGSGTASIVISKSDCTNAMPTAQELAKYLKEHPVEEV